MLMKKTTMERLRRLSFSVLASYFVLINPDAHAIKINLRPDTPPQQAEPTDIITGGIDLAAVAQSAQDTQKILFANRLYQELSKPEWDAFWSPYMWSKAFRYLHGANPDTWNFVPYLEATGARDIRVLDQLTALIPDEAEGRKGVHRFTIFSAINQMMNELEKEEGEDEKREHLLSFKKRWTKATNAIDLFSTTNPVELSASTLDKACGVVSAILWANQPTTEIQLENTAYELSLVMNHYSRSGSNKVEPNDTMKTRLTVMGFITQMTALGFSEDEKLNIIRYLLRIAFGTDIIEGYEPETGLRRSATSHLKLYWNSAGPEEKHAIAVCFLQDFQTNFLSGHLLGDIDHSESVPEDMTDHLPSGRSDIFDKEVTIREFKRYVKLSPSDTSDLGIEMGIEDPVLRGLRTTYNMEPDEFTTAVINKLIVRDGITWRQLLKALDDIQLGGIANKLRDKLLKNAPAKTR